MYNGSVENLEGSTGTSPVGFSFVTEGVKHMLFSSEQVSAGHPDKLCDQISDAILTDCLSHYHQSRVAIETMIKDNHVTVAG